ncbi:hypothetical protein [Altererythrobacter sp. BO-6]|uniref:hypothetical protein n=1 Tax=Altererythrobacter sp. BO-6 TaxID=2604537 RepID=UPI0019CFE3C9|nr:hypothetical protein [Altererythrobacter sp. BO-6]
MARKRSAILSMDAGPPLMGRRGSRRASRIWLWGGAIAVLLALAWFDGGEEPIRAISQEIPVPEAR